MNLKANPRVPAAAEPKVLATSISGKFADKALIKSAGKEYFK